MNMKTYLIAAMNMNEVLTPRLRLFTIENGQWKIWGTYSITDFGCRQIGRRLFKEQALWTFHESASHPEWYKVPSLMKMHNWKASPPSIEAAILAEYVAAQSG